MALEKMQSQYGPYNKSGQKGTGEKRDTFANEGTAGLESIRSKYGAKNKNGTPEKPTIDMGV
jgi:hypothetical protein|tara:strand:+ start:381 stop:566 length:186 start_codon:yes stop_codon:yes gene_type:complete